MELELEQGPRNDVTFFSPGSGHLLQHRVHKMPQACRLLHRAGGPLHALEADCLLPGGLHYSQEGRGDFRRLPHEAEHAQQARPRLRD